jgi:predicted nucleotidyltransferase component of viral defense system
MINRKEILAKAKQDGVPPDTIDKDYVLGHFLYSLFSFDWAQKTFLFKGGTCLRKCYFENYRFSEDIDITVIDDAFQLTTGHIKAVCEHLKERASIDTNILSFRPISHKNKQVGWDIEICYWGANHNPSETPVFRKDCHTKIYCELRFFEKVVFKHEMHALLHSYSDAHQIEIRIPCYGLHEVLAEKLRALIQRNGDEARDYFDLWYIKQHNEHINWQAVKDAFLEKRRFKNLEFHGFSDFFVPKRIKQVEITWEQRLSHQLPFSVNRKAVLTELELFFKELFPNQA